MPARLRSLLTYANVMATIAVFVALGGTSYAVATGSIDSREIKNATIQGVDVRSSTLTGVDVRNSALTGLDVRADSLNGSDIAESRLGKVPGASRADSAASADSAGRATSAGRADSATTAGRAGTAANADAVGGRRVVPFEYRSDNTGTFTTVAAVGGLEVQTACGGGDNDLYLYNRSGAPAEITFSNVDDDVDNTDGVEAVVADNNFQSVSGGEPDDDGVNGQAGFVTERGRSVRVFYTLNEGQFGFDCSISGLVIG